MTTSTLSGPTLFTLSDLHSNPALTTSIIRLANDSFLRPKRLDPVKWSSTGMRFPTLESYTGMLVEDSVVALIFDDGDDEKNENLYEGHDETNGNNSAIGHPEKLVACAAAVPWRGGWLKDGPETEDGWEIKAVCVDGDAKYARRGLAVQLLSFLEQHLTAKTMLQEQVSEERKEHTQGSLTLWIQAAECLNGAYWRKRGYQEIRRSTQGEGTWGCQTTFEIVVLKKIVHFDIAA